MDMFKCVHINKKPPLPLLDCLFDYLFWNILEMFWKKINFYFYYYVKVCVENLSKKKFNFEYFQMTKQTIFKFKNMITIFLN